MLATVERMVVQSEAIPAEVKLVISALEAGDTRRDRRVNRRQRYRVLATLRLFTDDVSAPPWLLYARDINSRGLGFVTAHRLPLGYGGIIEIPDPLGDPLSVHCTLLRCREAAPGWFEGSVYFNREQPKFNFD